MKEPKNYAFWKSIIDDPEQAAKFMADGNARQKREIKKVFKYIEQKKKSNQTDLFGEKI